MNFVKSGHIGFVSLINKAILKYVAEGILQPSDLGYNGPWEQFCDYDEIEKDYKMYPEHEVKRARLSVCNLRKQNITKSSESLSLLALCKYGHEVNM